MRLNHQLGSGFCPKSEWQRPRGLHPVGRRGNTCRRSPGTKPAWPCVGAAGVLGQRSKSEEAWKPAPGGSELPGSGRGQALGCLQWGLGRGSLHSLSDGAGGAQSRLETAGPTRQPGRLCRVLWDEDAAGWMLSLLCWSP